MLKSRLKCKVKKKEKKFQKNLSIKKKYLPLQRQKRNDIFGL